MAPGVSDGHVTGDVTWHWQVKSWPRHMWMQISQKRLTIEARCQWDTC